MGFDNFAPNALHDAAVDFRAFFPYTPNEVKHRKRTTSAQLKVLETVFRRDTKPNAALRNELAAQLDMTARGVQVWFQNRRAKEKVKSAKAAAAANGGMRSAVAGSPSSSALLGLDDELDERSLCGQGSSGPPIQLPDASLKPPQLHVITDSSDPEWQHSPLESTPDSAGHLGHSRSSLFAQHQSDLHNLRRGSLPVNAFPPSSFDSSSLEGPSSSQWLDPLARRRSVDASLQRLAHNPFANLARTKNTALFGDRFGMLSTSRHQSRVSISRRPPLTHLSSSPHVSSIRRSSMDSRGMNVSFRTNALSPAPANPPPFISSRASLPDHRLYAVTSRVVGSPIPGPLPSPDFSFGAASTPSMASPSSADSERNSPDSFTYPGNDDDGLSHYDYNSRFNSIASVATSESSVNSSYYSDYGVDPLLSHADLHNASRRNSCSPGHFMEFVDMENNGQYGLPETQTLSIGGYPSDEYGIPAPQGVTVPESVSNSYPSPTSTISAGNSPHTLDSVSASLNSSNIPISKTSELSFALHSPSEQVAPPAQHQQNHYTSAHPSDQQQDANACLTTASGDDTSTHPPSSLHQDEHDLGTQGQYTYSSSIPEFYPHGRLSLPTGNSGLPAALYNSFGEVSVSPLDTSGLQSFTAFA